MLWGTKGRFAGFACRPANTPRHSTSAHLQPFVKASATFTTLLVMIAAVNHGLSKSLTVASGHTASNAPDLFRTPKLSGAGPG